MNNPASMPWSRRRLLHSAAAALAVAPFRVQAEEDVPHVRVLFIGNSFMGRQGLPAMVGELMLSSGVLKPHIGSYLKENHNLDRHSQDPEGLGLLKQGADGQPWDVVVVQEHSVLAAAAAMHEEARQLTQQGLARLVAAVRQHNPKALVVVLQVWTRSESQWEANNADAVRTGRNYTEARRNIHRATAAAVQTVRQALPDAQLLISPAGDFWHLVLDTYPAMPLYEADGIHPDTLGSLLTALVLCGTIGGRDMLEKTTWISDLPFSQVGRVKKVLLDHPEVFKEAER